MRTLKIYKWYCISSWVMWALAFILMCFSGNAFHPKNEMLYGITYELTRILVLLSWLPVHPVLCILATHRSVKLKRTGYTVFNVVSIIITTIAAFILFVYYCWLIGA